MSDQNNDLKSTLLSNEPMPEAVPVKATAIGQKEEVAVNPIPAASSLVVSKDPIDPVLQTTIEEFEVMFDKAVATTKTSKESQEFPTPVRLTARLTDPSDANFYDILKGIFAAYLEKIDYTGLTKRIQQVEIDMDVNEAAIMLRASKEELNPYWYRISQAEIDIDGANSRIDLTASQLQLNINGIDYRLSQAQVDIDGANAQIALKASRTEIDDTIKRVSAAEIAINGANAEIALKASKASLDGAVQRVSAAEIAISGANAEIALRASKTEVNNVTNRVSAAEIAINGANAEIALRATKTETDAISSRVTTAEASITVNSNNIALKVSKTEFDPLATRVSTAETTITQNTSDIALRATKSDMDSLTGRVTNAEASIVTNAEQIALRATKSDLDSVTGRVTTAESSIVANATSIASKVAKTEFDPVVGRVSTAESLITQYAGKISLMVAEDNTIKAGVIVDAINGGTVKIAANKVQIDGTTTFAPGYNPSESVRYLYMQENDPSLSWDAAYKEKMLNARWTKTSTTEDSVEYIYQNVAGSYVWVENSTVIDGGRIKTGILEAQYIDVENLFAKELIATNMYVKNGRIGDFLINNNLTGSGYTNGTLNGNQIVLDPSNNEIVLSKNGMKRVRLTNNELTPLALLQVDGGTIACTNGTSVAWSTTNGIIASKNLLGVGGNGISKTMYVGINRPNPVIASTVEGIVKFNLQPGMYSLDMPFSLCVLHGKGFDVNSDKTDGRYNRITGVNDAYVTVKLMTATGVVSTQSFYVELKLDTVDTGNDTFFGRIARFNFTVSSAADYWMEVNYTIKGGATRPIRYQSYNHATTFRHSYWSEQYERAVHYDMIINPGMTVDGSIGITELSNSGFQSVWTPTRYIRIDGNTDNNVFIESWGTWYHNGKPVSFDKETITSYVDQNVIATKSFVTQGYYDKTQSDGRYLGINAAAADSAKLGGVAASSYYNSTNANIDTVNWKANLLQCNNENVSGYVRSSRKAAPGYVGNWSGTNWWGIGEYDSTTVQLAQVASDMSFNGGVANFRVNGSITATSGIYGAIYGDTFIKDTRSVAFATPNDTKATSVQWDFKPDTITGLTGANSWTSVMTVKGWAYGYAVAQIFFPANDANSTDLFYRTGQGTAWNSIVPIWTGYNLNRSDKDFVARNITAAGNATFNYATKHYLRTGNTAYTGGFYYDIAGNESLLFAFKQSNTHIKFKLGYDFENISSGGATNMADADLDIGMGVVKFGGNAQSSTYSGSGFTATGWGITTDGDANFRNHTVRGKLTTYEFVQSKISIANGNMIVSDNAKPSSFSKGTDSSGRYIDFWFTEACPFKVGDVLRIQSATTFAELPVAHVQTDGKYIVCRNFSDASYNAVTSTELLVRWNSTDAARKGLLYLCSSDAGSPNYQVLYDGAVKAQFGNLEGRSWLGSTLPANTWGLWAENAYLSGAVNATSGNIGGMTITAGELSSPIEGGRNNYINQYAIGTWDSGGFGVNQLHRNGSGYLAKGNIAWDAAGNVTFADSVKLQWQSGGRNYLRNSSLEKRGGNEYLEYANTTNCFDLGGVGVYTISFDLKSDVAGNINVYSTPDAASNFKYIFKSGAKFPINATTTYKRYSVTVEVVTSNLSSTWSSLSFYGEYGSGRIPTVNNVKIEKGYNATDWTSALEDVDSKLTRITSDGIYTGKIKAENIEGDLLIGKTIQATNVDGARILELHGKDGTLTGFSDAGVIQSQLSRGSLTFFDSLGVPAVFLRNIDISLSECKNSGSIYEAAISTIPLGIGSAVSDGFTISNVGAYKGTIPMSISANGSITVEDTGHSTIHTNVVCTVSVHVSVDLEWCNPSTGLYEPYLNGVASISAYKNSTTTSASCSKTGDAILSFTTAKTGTFRLKFSHTSNCYGRAWSTEDPNVDFDVTLESLTSSVSNTGAVTGSKISNGTYIGKNGFISYNGTNGESFVVFDKSYGIQFQAKANTDLISLNEVMKLSVRNDYVEVLINGTTTLKVTNTGRIFIYGAPAVSANASGTGNNRYRLYLDEYNQLCRRPDNGW